VLGIKQPNVSSLMRNCAGGFSVGWLMEFLTALRPDVQISLRKMQRPREKGYLSAARYVSPEQLSRFEPVVRTQLKQP
jgi:hypothetical protein